MNLNSDAHRPSEQEVALLEEEIEITKWADDTHGPGWLEAVGWAEAERCYEEAHWDEWAEEERGDR
jgi:hypothetical protein